MIQSAQKAKLSSALHKNHGGTYFCHNRLKNYTIIVTPAVAATTEIVLTTEVVATIEVVTSAVAATAELVGIIEEPTCTGQIGSSSPYQQQL